MRLETSSTLISASGVEHKGGFAMRASATAFNILSSKLYSDKISAVLREIGCNAFDSHIMAGIRDVPFLVKLPTALDDSFYIRDYGIGLSEEQTMSLFCTYFASSKDDSNDCTGAFGLGSKSPFAYTDRFTVRAAQDGIARTFACYFDEKGSPAVAKVEEVESPEWPNGVEVGFAVKPDDINEFARKAGRIFGVFETVPTVIGAKVVSVIKEINNGWYSLERDESNYYHRDRLHVRMGNVSYPVMVNQLNHGNARDVFLAHLTESNVIFDVPMGAVDVAVSRESLEYTDKTKAAIAAYVEKAKTEMAGCVTQLLDGIDYRSIDGLKDANAKLRASGFSKALLEVFWDNTLTFGGWTLKAIWDGQVHPFEEFTDFAIPVSLRFHNGKVKSWLGRVDAVGEIQGLRWHNHFFRLEEKPLYVLDDGPLTKPDQLVSSLAMRRGRNALRTGDCTNVFFIRPQASKTQLEAEADFCAKAKVALGPRLASVLPKPKAVKRDKNAPKKNRVLPWQARSIPAVDLMAASSAHYNWINPDATLQATMPRDTTFYLTRRCTYGHHSIAELHRHNTPQPVINAFREAREGNVSCPIALPTHLVIATATEMKQAKMEEAGYRPLQQWFNDAKAAYAAQPAVASAPKKKLMYGKHVQYTYNEEAVRMMLWHRANDTPLWQAAKHRIERTPLNDFLDSMMALKNLESDHEDNTTATDAFYEFLNGQNVSVPVASFTHVDPDAVCKEWETTHMPWLNFIAIPRDHSTDDATNSKLVELLDLIIPSQTPLLAAVA